MKRFVILIVSISTLIPVNLFSQEKLMDVLGSLSCIDRKVNLDSLLLLQLDPDLNLLQINQDFRLNDKVYILLNNPTDSLNWFCILPIKIDGIGLDKLRLSSSYYFLIDKINQRCFSFQFSHNKPIDCSGTDMPGEVYLRCENKISRGVFAIWEYLVPPYNEIMVVYLRSLSNYLDGHDIGNFTSLAIKPNNEDPYINVDYSILRDYNIYKITYNEFLGLKEHFDKEYFDTH